MADDGPLQMSLFDQHDLAEITSNDFPGERLIASATRSWPPTGPAPARTCWPPPRNCSPESSSGSRPANSPAPGRGLYVAVRSRCHKMRTPWLCDRRLRVPVPGHLCERHVRLERALRSWRYGPSVPQATSVSRLPSSTAIYTSAVILHGANDNDTHCPAGSSKEPVSTGTATAGSLTRAHSANDDDTGYASARPSSRGR
jgi:hypothetical protein